MAAVEQGVRPRRTTELSNFLLANVPHAKTRKATPTSLHFSNRENPCGFLKVASRHAKSVQVHSRYAATTPCSGWSRAVI